MEGLKALTMALVRFKTVAGNIGEKKRCLDFVEKYFRGTGLVVKRYKCNNSESLMILTKATKKPMIMMNCHLDVVPGDESQFKPVLIDGSRLYGRGTADMKSQAAVMMSVMRDFAPLKDKLSLGLMITTDEETGGENGAQYLLSRENYSAEVVIAPDCVSDFDIIIKEKGIINLRLAAQGRPVHGSRPWEGENALETLIDMYDKIRKMFPEPPPHDRWRPTVTLGKMSGGTAVNTVAGSGEMFINIRLTEKESFEKIMKRIKSLNPKVRLEIIHRATPLIVSEKNPYVQSLKKIIEKRLKRKSSMTYDHGGSDARFFADKNIPVLIFGPKGGGYHGEDEYVDLNSLERMKEIIIEFIEAQA